MHFVGEYYPSSERSLQGFSADSFGAVPLSSKNNPVSQVWHEESPPWPLTSHRDSRNAYTGNSPGDRITMPQSFSSPSLVVRTTQQPQHFSAPVESPARHSVDSTVATHRAVIHDLPPRPSPSSAHRPGRIPRREGAGYPPRDHCSAALSRHKTKRTDPQNYRASTPIVFATHSHPESTISVASGASQQELLRRKAREDYRRRRYRKERKRKNSPIVNIPLALSQSLTVRRTFYDPMASVAGSDRDTSAHHLPSDAPRAYRPMTTILDHDERTQGQAARTSPRRPHYARGTTQTEPFGTPSLYSTLPMQQAVLNEADGDSLLHWSPLEDEQSTHSFPILSNHCGFSASGLENEAGKHQFAMDETENASEGKTLSKRAVRFSQQDSQISIPWNEQNERDHTSATPSRSDSVAVVSPSPSPRPPQSILRATRFTDTTPLARTSIAYYAQLQAFRDKQLPQSPMRRDNKERVVYKSPPKRNATIMDQPGSELSPITPSPMLQRTTNKPQVDPVTAPTGDYKNSHTFEAILEHASQVYHGEPCFPDEDAVTLPRDTELECDSQSSFPVSENADAASIVDEADFIRTIAAVVIQTAFRRHRVQWIFTDMLLRRRLQRQRLERIPNRYQSQSLTPLIATLPPAVDACSNRSFCPEAAETSGRDQTDYPYSSSEFRVVNGFSVGKEKTPHGTGSLEDHAATMIQTAFRGYWARDCLAVDNYCATLIQKTWRSYGVRHTYVFDLYRIVLVQSLWRRRVAYNRACILYYAAILIQATARGYLARKIHRRIKRKMGSKLLAYRFVERHANKASLVATNATPRSSHRMVSRNSWTSRSESSAHPLEDDGQNETGSVFALWRARASSANLQ